MFPENGGRIGTYFHLFPTYAQGKKIIWDSLDKTGFKVTDHFPDALVAGRNESELQITLTNGSIYQVIGTDKIDSIVGTNPVGCVFSEFSLQNPKAWDLISPILLENDGWALFNFTPRGHNHGEGIYKMARQTEGWYCTKFTVDDTVDEAGNPVITKAAIDSERVRMLMQGMAEADVESFIQQEYYCSFEGYQEGSYYAKQMLEAESQGRITSVPFNPRLPVATFWDLGIGDATAIWFAQRVGQEIHLIDYYETSGEGMSYYAKHLNQKPYQYSEHYFPHDGDVREIGTGVSRKETAESLGLVPIEIVPKLSPDDGINAARLVFPRCWFDKEKCKQGLSALASYHKKFDDERREFKNKPEHDWSSHGADAFRYFAVSVENASWNSSEYGSDVQVISNYNH